MRKALLLLLFAGLFESGMSQGFTFHCTRDTAIGCSLNCFTLKALIPDLHGLTTSYNINPLSTVNACYNPQVDPNIIGTTIINPVDDKYTQPLNISFPFPFFGQTYTQILASTNGYTCFDLTRAGLFSHWQICQSGGALSGIGTPLDLPSTLYDKGLIMGPYHDLYPVGATSPSMYMKYDTIGVAPYRKWVLSFYKIPLFSCTTMINNTNQIALYESTGIVEIYIAEQQICLGWNEGRAMVGMQDMSRTSAIMAPGRRASDPPWGTAPMAESWRFVPSAGPSLFKRVELYSLSGTLLSIGDTAAYGNGTLQATFLNVCPSNNSTTSFVIKSFYKKIDDTTQEIMGIDTINVIRNAGVINATTTPASCATGQGTVTVTTPLGPTLEYSIDSGVTWQASNIFLNVPSGPHTVIARIVGTTCSSSTMVTISPLNTLTATYSTVDAACNGSASGSIIVTASLGTPQYTFSLDGGPFQISDTFVNVLSGNHTIVVKDAGQCTFTLTNVFVANGGGIVASATETNVTCPGASNGTIQVTPLNGQGPYTYSINGGPFLSNGGLFTGLTAGNYSIIVKDNTGCTSTVNKTVGTDAGGVTATATTTNSGCTPSGTITVNIQPPATGPFTYTLDGGVPQPSPLLTYVFTGVSGGAHTVYISQGGSCTTTVPVTVGTSAGITAIADSTNTECSSAFTGTISVTASNGVAPYSYKIDGGAFQLSGIFTGLAAGPHTLTVQDNSGCSYSFIKNVGTGSGITATALATNSACGTASTGTITVTGNGISPYLYKIDAGVYQGSNFFSGLTAGTHTITVKDSAGCTFTFNQVVGANTGVTATAATTNTACGIASNGTITVNAVNGISPYTYKIDGGAFQGSNFFSGLVSGPHTILVQDSAGCTYSFIQNVSANTGVTALATATNTACAGASTGTISVNAQNGISPYLYNINAGPYQVSNLFSGLSAGTYTLTVKDSAGCIGTVIQIVVASPGFTATATTTNTACTGISTGTITVINPNGVAPYTYNIDGGAFQPAPLFSGLAAGNHTLVVNDAVGCAYTFSQIVTANPGVNANATPTNTACASATNGTITVNTTSGTAPFTYSMDGGALLPTNLFVGLATGSHTIMVRDALGCTLTFNQVITANTGVTAIGVPVNTACASASTGSINVTASAGLAPYSYSINGGAYQASNQFTGLAATTYTIGVRDAAGCTFTFNQTVGADAGVTATATSSNTACTAASNGSITVFPSAGVSPYTFKVDAGAFQISNLFTGLTTGLHNIVVKDAAGCTFPLTQNITANPGVTATPTIGNAGCPGSNTGVIQMTPSAGIAPYTYSLNGGAFQALNTFSNLAAGTYTVIVMDSAGCTFTSPVTVGTNPLVTATLTVVQPGCFGTASGSITAQPSLGTFPYQFAINAGAFQVSNTFANLIAGNYVIHVKDATNCTFDTSLTLNQPALFKVSASTVSATCNGNDGHINITAIGGTAPFQYSIDGGATYGLSGSIIDSIGSYNIRIKDANGCTADTSVVIVLTDAMNLSLSPDTTVCFGSTVAFTPLTNPQTNIFNWTPAGGILNPATGAYTVSPGDTTIYSLTAKWGVCQRTVSGRVNVLHKPVAYAGADTIICDKTVAFLRGSATNLSGQVSYLWSPASDIFPPDTTNTPTTVVHPRTRGQNIYTLEVDDNYGCNFKVFDKIAVTMNPPVPAFAGRDTIAAMDLPHQLFGSGGINYLWSPPNLLDNPTKKNPIAILHSDTRFVLTVIDNGGCIGTDTVFIKVYKGPTYYIPNAFTPNGDGLNDIFLAIPPGITKTEYFRVFNRWGQLIFDTHDYMKGWDGTYIGKPQPAGAYVWIIKGVDKYGKPVEMRGTVMLIR